MSTTQPTMSLRELAKEYAGGRIDRQTFRQRRARLLNELASYTPPTPQQQATHAENPGPELKPQVKEHKRSKLFIGLTGSLAFFVLAGSLIYMNAVNHESAKDQPTSSVAESSEPPRQVEEIVAPVQDTTGQIENDPIKNFVVLNDWSPENRTRLLLQWDMLSQASKELFSSTSWFLSFSAELRTMIKEERGLAGGETSEEVNLLIAFAARVGLDFSPVDREIDTIPSSKPVENTPLPVEKSKAVESKTAPKSSTTPSLNSEQELTSKSKVTVDSPPEPEQKTESIESNEVVEKEPISAATQLPLPQKPVVPEKTTQNPLPDRIKTDEKPTSPELESCRPLRTNRKITKCRDQLKNGAEGPWLQLLPGGRFTMGRDDIKSESPSHPVNIGYPFAIGAYEVSHREFSIFCKATGFTCPPQPWRDNTFPVVNINREDAKQYAKWLSIQSGRGYRLPTESEWEYAARGGTTTAYPIPESDLGTYAHFSDRSREKAPLPRRPQRTNPNQFGIFNMAGNVREWVLDSWTDGYETVPKDGSPYNEKQLSGIARGGSYADNKGPLHSSARQQLPYRTKDVYTGFRLVRDIYLRQDQENLARWGDWWLSFQQDEHLTIQLFTMSNLDQAQRLIDKHPRHSLKVISSNQPTTRYLILFGLYDSKSDAITATQSLPNTLKNAESDFRIRSIRELR
ncbi:MAG: SUMF1/EgtB/PvdO family nonheme iron enzyme [Pseudomonadota bacterium]